MTPSSSNAPAPTSAPSASKLADFGKSLFSPTGWKAALVGAAGGFFGFLCGELVGRGNPTNLLDLLWGSALWAGLIGMALGAVILAWENQQSLRGRWNRDLAIALPLFGVLGFLGGGAGQLSYSFIQNSLTRGIGWALMGCGIGVGIGLLRRDFTQAGRGALGGLIGGFAGGLLFDALGFLVSTAGNGAFSRAFGLILTGAMIALFMRAVQQAMQSAWLMGISSGPYEGKEYPLNTARITVGQTELNDIALYRDRSVPARAGAFVFENSNWRWISESPDASVLVNNRMTIDAVLQPGSQIQIGDTRFLFQARSLRGQTYTAPSTSAPSATTLPTTAQPTNIPPNGSALPHIPGHLPINPPVVTGWQLQHPQMPLQIGANGVWTVGRADENDLVINDGTVSSRHARLEARAGVLAIVDVGSTNGTFLNDVRLVPNVPAALRNGDRLKLGQSEFSIRQIEAF